MLSVAKHLHHNEIPRADFQSLPELGQGVGTRNDNPGFFKAFFDFINSFNSVAWRWMRVASVFALKSRCFIVRIFPN